MLSTNNTISTSKCRI